MAPRIAATRRRRIGTIGFVAPKTPVNSVAPVASGGVTVGSVLSVTTGTWSNSPTGYTYQWTRDAVNIASATANTYTLVTADIGAMISCTVTAVNADGSNIAYSNSLGPVTAVPVAPSNTLAPVASGGLSVNSVLSVTNGTWTGVPAPTFTYQWKRGGVDVAGATASSYTLVVGDVGAMMSCSVTATNATGSATAASNSVGPVTAATAPVNSVAPAVTGSTTVGSLLSCSQGTWTGSPTGYAYQWKQGASNISGATSSTYTLVTADIGASISCVVTATNVTGSTPATSNSVGPVTAAASTGTAGGSALLVGENDGFAADFTHAIDAQRVAVKVDGSVIFGVGGAALIADEANGLAVDFTYPVDANRVAVKVDGIAVFGTGGASLLTDERLGLGVDFTYSRDGSRVAVKT
jgi:hypothetical protein